MYVAARGGESAVLNAERLYHALKDPASVETVRMITRAMPYLVDRVMGEGSLYEPDVAALALAQAGGDLYEAVLMLRAYRSTLPRLGYAAVLRWADMRVVRRISAAFKDIPGGQILGPTLDYSHRLLDLAVLDGAAAKPAASEDWLDDGIARPMDTAPPPVADWQRAQGFLPTLNHVMPADPAELPDVTRQPLVIPAGRGARLQSLSRAETGGVLALGYANMRGYGSVHPTINELRLAYANLMLTHPISGEPFCIGRMRVSMAEVVTTVKRAEGPAVKLGFCATMGWNEVKTIAGAMLDMAMDLPEPHASHTEEYVLYHTDPVESSGFCIHYKLPHYVTFGSSMDAAKPPVAQSAKEGYHGDGSGVVAGSPGVYAEDAAPIPLAEMTP
jgi:alpha-D-ribose 1-methylphosphonate 5-triphosphate synthase subunit PhnI